MINHSCFLKWSENTACRPQTSWIWRTLVLFGQAHIFKTSVDYINGQWSHQLLKTWTILAWTLVLSI